VKIALVKLSSLGDVVHALPVAVTLRACRPDAHITWVVESSESAVLQGHDAIDEILAVDTRLWRRARRPARLLRAARDLLVLRRRLAATGFDVVIDLQGLLKSGLVTAATGAALRVGFARGRCREPLSAVFTNRRITPPTSSRHVIEQYLSTLSALDITASKVEFRVPASRQAEARVDGFLAATGLKPRDRLVVVSPGAGREAKRWPVTRYRELATRLRDEAAAATVVAWGPGEADTAQAITGPAAALLAPPTSIPELVALLRRATAVVASDTGPLHLAAAVGTRCVGLYGPTDAERNGPYGHGHRALQSPDGQMTGLTVSAVLTAVLDLL